MASLAGMEITVAIDAATAALVAIRHIATGVMADPSSDRGDALADIRAVADRALKQAQAKPRVRHA